MRLSVLAFILSSFLVFSSNAHCFTIVASCDESPSPTNCEEIRTCQTLYDSHKYYLLMENVTANGTCFNVSASNFTFDLNGKEIEYAQTTSGHAFSDSGSRNSIIIRNGMIKGDRKLGYTNSYSHAISFNGSSDDLEIYDLHITIAGLQTQGFSISGGRDLKIHDVVIDMDSQKENIYNHGVGHLPGIGVSGRGGSIDIYNNRITGNGMLGIATTSCGNWDINTDGYMLIHDNYVSMWSPVRDGYAIMIASNNGSCSDGTKVYNNTIEQINGRGIIVDGWESDSPGPGNVEIYENYIDVREGRDVEYPNDFGIGAGIRVRFGANNIHAHDNFITGQAGYNVAVGSDPSKDGSRVIGLYLGSKNPRGVNNRYTNNYIDVSTNHPDGHAIGIYVAGGNPGNESMPSFFEGNTIKSNNQPIRVSYDDGGGYNAHFDSTTIIKGDNPLDFHSIGIGFWTAGAKNITFKDVITQNGASVYDMEFYPCNGGCTAVFEDIKILWTLNTLVESSSGTPASNASVEIRDVFGNIVSLGNTDYSGMFTAEVVERSYEGNDQGIETVYTPHIITVSYHGNTISRTIDITAPRTEVFRFDGSDTCGDINDDGSIDLADIEFLMNYMFEGGIEPSPYLRGDVTQDGSVDISDIVHLVNYLYQNGPEPCTVSQYSSENFIDWTKNDVLKYIEDAQNYGYEVSGGCGVSIYNNFPFTSILIFTLIFICALFLIRKRRIS